MQNAQTNQARSAFVLQKLCDAGQFIATFLYFLIKLVALTLAALTYTVVKVLFYASWATVFLFGIIAVYLVFIPIGSYPIADYTKTSSYKHEFLCCSTKSELNLQYQRMLSHEKYLASPTEKNYQELFSVAKAYERELLLNGDILGMLKSIHVSDPALDYAQAIAAQAESELRMRKLIEEFSR